MLEVESKVGSVKRNVDEIYNLLTNFKLIESYIPKEQVEDFVVEEDKCSFTVQGQKVVICIIDKEENNFIKYGSDNDSKIKFFFWIQMKSVEIYSTKIKLTLHIDLPFFMHPFVKSKIENALNEVVDKISSL